MNLRSFEKLFQTAWVSIDKRKYLLVFFTLCLCGLVAVFSRVLSIGSGKWVILSLSFLPIFLSTSLLFSLGVFLVNLYDSEQRGESFSLHKIFIKSLKPIVSVCYITLPLFLIYLLAWLVLGVFFLLKEIPGIGDLMGVFLSFGPFILILASLFLAFLNVAFLFFLTPQIALKENLNLKLWKDLGISLKRNMLLSISFLFISALPIVFILSFLIGAAFLTKMSYFSSINPLFVGLQWFFLMLPFNALLTPFVVFFFNFATETHFLLSQRNQEWSLPKTV
jgi:hypothetical protein